jgi:hypothetical protein
MRINLGKISSQNKNNIKWIETNMSQSLNLIHPEIVDLNKVGDVYVFVFKDASGVRKITHHVVIVDVVVLLMAMRCKVVYYI